MRGKTLLGSIICGLTVIAFHLAAATTPSLAGSWQFTLTPTAPQAAAIPGLATFTTDGSAIETDGSELVPIRLGTPGHGIWQIANTPSTLYVQYISLIVNPDGSLYARNVTTMFVALNSAGNQFEGSYTIVQEIGASTTIVSSGTVSGQLIPHVPLP